MAKMLQFELPVCGVKFCEIERGEITSRIIQKHVFGTGVRCVDAAVLRTRMPLIDDGIVLSPRIGTNPGRPSDPVPQLPRLDGLTDFPVRSAFEMPIAVCFERGKKLIGNPDAVVGVLAGDGLVGLTVPIRVILVKHKVREALLRIGKHSLNIRLGHHIPTGQCQGLTQERIGLRIEIQPERALAIDRMTSFQHGIEALGTNL